MVPSMMLVHPATSRDAVVLGRMFGAAVSRKTPFLVHGKVEKGTDYRGRPVVNALIVSHPTAGLTMIVRMVAVARFAPFEALAEPDTATDTAACQTPDESGPYGDAP